MAGTPHSASQQASDTLAALESYQGQVRRLIARPHDAELYQAVSTAMDAVRGHCRELPGATGAWIGLLIAHAELVQALWRAADAAASAEREQLLGQVVQRVRDLQRLCMDLLGPPGGA